MRLVAKIYVSYDGITNENAGKGLEAILESGAESTCSSASLVEAYPEDDVIVISKNEYKSLQEAAEFLSCLQACGVDNWGGYSDAIQMMEEEE